MGISSSDGNTVTCCENKNVQDLNGNDLRLCSAIDKERIQAEEEKNRTFSYAYVNLYGRCSRVQPGGLYQDYIIPFIIMSCETKKETVFKGAVVASSNANVNDLKYFRDQCKAKSEKVAIYDPNKPNTENIIKVNANFINSEWKTNLNCSYRHGKCSEGENVNYITQLACPSH